MKLPVRCELHLYNFSVSCAVFLLAMSIIQTIWKRFASVKSHSLIVGFLFSASVIWGSLMDLDHFVAARSFKLSDATSLARRPFLHNTPLVFLISVIVFFCVKHLARDFKTAFLWSMCLLNAWLTHQLRDALRRGLWLQPLMQDTGPLTMKQYIMSLFSLFMIQSIALQKLPTERISKVWDVWTIWYPASGKFNSCWFPSFWLPTLSSEIAVQQFTFDVLLLCYYPKGNLFQCIKTSYVAL